MRVIYVSILCILCLMGFFLYLSYPLYHARKMAREISSTATAYEQHPITSNMHVLVAGDSTAVGAGAANNTESIAGRLGTQFPNATISNIGVSGAKLKDLLQVLLKHKNRHYDLLILQIGTNDITHFTSYNTMREQLSKVLELASRLSAKTLVLTAGDIGRARVFKWPLSSLMTHRSLKVRQIFLEETPKHKNAFYVDLYVDRDMDPFEKNLTKYYAKDNFHLTGDGYGFWYSFVQKFL